MNRVITNLLVADVTANADFFEHLLGMTRLGDFGWYIVLGHDDLPGLELGILDQSHDSVPSAMNGPSAGVLMTFVVDDVEAIHKRATSTGAVIVAPPTDLPYGQRRMLLRDPSGRVIDISSPTPR